ncbi:transcriptional regulator [Methylobacterium sp. NEAU 140]|uniref:transcriptional regulator n=1 Tax=Methylobacterium sp. NEAU 140 TaxID=3064945 RepID=UPI00273483B8|nr:transcriptional regulator [Methylobacterium sp. NEAU 140]MDP4027005.1 transcriptional regulator [Methylobacterium sp. NEAU 140]
MFADEIRRAVEAAPRVKLPAVAAMLWRAFGAGQVTEAEAETLSELIEARKIPPATPAAPRRAVGSRPRTDASLERRRRWAASGRLPPQLAARFTLAEQAVLAVVASEVMKHGRCTLAHGHLAALAGVSDSTVKRALRAARVAGLLNVEVRRVSAFRNDTNVVTIAAPEWTSWLRLAPRGVGVGQDLARVPISSRLAISGRTAPSQGLPRGGRIGESQRHLRI